MLLCVIPKTTKVSWLYKNLTFLTNQNPQCVYFSDLALDTVARCRPA